MKKLLLVLMICCTGCTANQKARNFGGTETIDLEPGRKLVNATWKQNSLWYLTRQARPDELPEVYQFKEKSSFGVVEGTVVFKEHAAK